MLTVMYRAPNGTENLFEAVKVYRDPPEGQESIPPLGHITAVLPDTDPGQPGYEVRLDISEPFGAVFVMNRYGSTVQKYIGSRPTC